MNLKVSNEGWRRKEAKEGRKEGNYFFGVVDFLSIFNLQS